jgi:hypothetical protein
MMKKKKVGLGVGVQGVAPMAGVDVKGLTAAVVAAGLISGRWWSKQRQLPKRLWLKW